MQITPSKVIELRHNIRSNYRKMHSTTNPSLRCKYYIRMKLLYAELHMALRIPPLKENQLPDINDIRYSLELMAC